MKKLILCSLMFCATMTASAFSYEPPKVGIDVPDIGYTIPSVTTVEVAMVAFDYMMAQDCAVEFISPVAVVSPFMLKVGTVASKSETVTVMHPGYNGLKLKIPPMPLGLSSFNSMCAVQSPHNQRQSLDSHKFRLRGYRAAYSGSNGFTDTKYIYKI